MLTTVRGIYQNGQIILHETPSVQDGTEVFVTFLNEVKPNEPVSKGGVRFGSWAGKYSIPDDFNEPLDDLVDYM
ncbi:hypothetical protein [uncultured Spirosoma sp.]|uniref:hypothetical protein n=1 Tax=uncultured Spirosoma sp. TaxID=278208 RepID=UPI002584212D|nr:hypothetical protein [uncultured Spirosoma sp.]